MGKKLQKIYVTCYNLLIAQDLWQAYYQILSVITLKELIELISNTMIKKFKHIATVFLNFKDDLIECKYLCCNKSFQHKVDKKLKERFFHT